MEAPKKRRTRALTGLLVVVFLGGWLLSLVSVVAWGAMDFARRSDAIVVMGAAQYVGRPSPVLRARLDHALLLWKRGEARWMILTGGTGSGDTTSEAAVSRRYVMRHGVPDSAILLENAGRTTSESLRAVAAMMGARGMKSAIMVSDPFHMLRLAILARRLGLTAATSPTRTSPISSSVAEVVGYVLSESVKVPLTFALGTFD
jgi:uncharacterized SAM-binding protein YcdF (DUF218 family)